MGLLGIGWELEFGRLLSSASAVRDVEQLCFESAEVSSTVDRF